MKKEQVTINWQVSWNWKKILLADIWRLIPRNIKEETNARCRNVEQSFLLSTQFYTKQKWSLTILYEAKSHLDFRGNISYWNLLEGLFNESSYCLRSKPIGFYFFRTLSNIKFGAFSGNTERLTLLIIFTKSFILSVWQGSEHASGVKKRTFFWYLKLIFWLIC